MKCGSDGYGVTDNCCCRCFSGGGGGGSRKMIRGDNNAWLVMCYGSGRGDCGVGGVPCGGGVVGASRCGVCCSGYSLLPCH